MSLENETRTYPLKIIEMDNFFLNSDELLNANQESQDFHNQHQSRKHPSKDSKYTLLFIDSEKYRQCFEKTHLKLKNNIIVLDRNLNFTSLEELNQFYNLMFNSKRWLLHGTLKCQNDTESKETKRKSTHLVDRFTEDKNTELLLILNSDDSFIKPILENGFNKLINSFSNSMRSTFEINFENIIKSYWVQKFEETEPLYKLEELKSSLKPFRFNVMFTASNSIFAKTHLETLNSDKISSKFGNIFSRIKSVISNNNNKHKQKALLDVSNQQNIHTEFSLDLLPSLFYYLSDNKVNFNCISFNDDQYNRTRRRKSKQEMSNSYNNRGNLTKLITNTNNNNQSLELANRFQTYVVKSKTKLKNYDKIDNERPAYITENEQEDSFRSSTDSKLSSDESNNKQQEDLANKNTSNSDSTVNSSMSSLSSSISNYINKKKKLTKSTSINFVFENLDDENLLNSLSKSNEIESTNDSNEKAAKFCNEDFNYDYKNKHQAKSYDNVDSNRRNYVIDEKIIRHPALVKQKLKLKSKSYDVFEPNNTENNLKQNVTSIATKSKYKKNSRMLQSVVIPSNQHEEHENISNSAITSNSMSSLQNNSIEMKNQNNNKLKISTVNNYKMLKMSTQKTAQRSSVYAKTSYSRQKSPPPPISLSSTGLLAPPPMPNSSPKIVTKKSVSYSPPTKAAQQNYLAPISRIKSDVDSSRQNEHKNEFHSINRNTRESQNYYNRLYLKNGNEIDKKESIKNKILSNFDDHKHSVIIGLKQSYEGNRFRINNYNHLDYNTEKVF